MTETRRRAAALLAALSALAAGLAMTGCSSAGDNGSGMPAGGSCGTARTAAGVPVTIRVIRGTVDCAVALAVERDYATMIRRGEVPGNGGGAPVNVRGWTCTGYPTPQVLRTGDASACHSAKAEVVAVLAAPSASAGS